MTDAPTNTAATSNTTCQGCGAAFVSRNAVFAHLKKTAGACLSGPAYADFVHYCPIPDEKVILLYGYRLVGGSAAVAREACVPLSTGDEAAAALVDACCQVSRTAEASPENGAASASTTTTAIRPKFMRSYGSTARKTNHNMVAQDDGTAGALTEILATKLPPLGRKSLTEWIAAVNAELRQRHDRSGHSPDDNAPNSAVTPTHLLSRVILFGRRPTPGKTFHAEMDVTHRKVDYLLPAAFLGLDVTQERTLLPSCQQDQVWTRPEDDMTSDSAEKEEKADITLRALKYMQQLKKAMQGLTTQIVKLDVRNTEAVEKKAAHVRKRQRLRKKQAQDLEAPIQKNVPRADARPSATPPKEAVATGNVLERKRFHNFTPTVMAHEYLASRRLDRFFHKATIWPEGSSRPFLVLSLTGDLFLKGQVVRVIGTWLAVQRQVIDADILDCLFDTHYPSLVPTPPLPPHGLYATTAMYMQWEGKAHAILTPRASDRYPDGWNDPATLQAVQAWGNEMRQAIVATWAPDAAETWVRTVLEPWAVQARRQLVDYRRWKAGQDSVSKANEGFDGADALSSVTTIPRPLSVTPAPVVYEAVLHHLRQIDASGHWPETSAKRQVVMVTEASTGSGGDGDNGGNAKGSFSVGYMPRLQPKNNALFPEFCQAAFALERALRPDREPSSTIAVNRNAQFRPYVVAHINKVHDDPHLPINTYSRLLLLLFYNRHVDNGAGAGQSTSLIVGLGDYTGGGLVVENEEHDIRYKSMEFNGWTQRHWTLPFEGERFSLVWFTPKGCEGMRGVDLPF
jgi:tRNA U38,U39,U40 pseudouridine synthase TruA